METSVNYKELSTNKKVEFLYDKLEIEFNTGVNNIPLPMLAKAVNWSKVTYPCLVQPKLDGIRCLAISTNDGQGQPITTFLSRQGKEFTTLDHIKKDIDAYQYSWLPGLFILDAEIYSDELTFQEISQAVKKQYPNSLKLKLRVYDIVDDGDQSQRWDRTHKLVDIINSDHILPVITTACDSKELIKSLHDQYVQQGYEGAMIRLSDGKYGQGQRSSSLLKVKEFSEDEFKLIGWELGQRGVQDLLAVIELDNGIICKPTMMGNIAYKQHVYDTIKFPAKLTVKYFGLTDEGSLRHPNGKAIRDYE